VGRYRQYCPISRATEILGERWTLLVVRNLLMGADTFTAIARGAPTMSRSVLVRRLDELTRAGVIVTNAKPGGGSAYHLTAAGRDLAAVVDQLGDWATTWVEVTHEHTDPGFALWAWCAAQLNTSALPVRRTVVGFTFPDERPSNRRYWLLAENHAAELCYSYTGGPVDVDVVAQSKAFVDWNRGARSWTELLRSGDLAVSGNVDVARALPTWNTHDSGRFTDTQSLAPSTSGPAAANCASRLGVICPVLSTSCPGLQRPLLGLPAAETESLGAVSSLGSATGARQCRIPKRTPTAHSSLGARSRVRSPA
jgi:DNA-binding HxlR family transcriptional regulator